MHLWLIFLIVTSTLPKFNTILLSNLRLMMVIISLSAEVLMMIF